MVTKLHVDNNKQIILQNVPLGLQHTTCRFYRAMLAQSAVMRLHVVRPSVCLSVCNDQVP